MTREEAAERALIHSSLAVLMHQMTRIDPRDAPTYDRSSRLHEDWASCYRNLITTPTPPTDDQPKEGSTEVEVPAQRDPEGEEGAAAEDEVTG